MRGSCKKADVPNIRKTFTSTRAVQFNPHLVVKSHGVSIRGRKVDPGSQTEMFSEVRQVMNMSKELAQKLKSNNLRSQTLSKRESSYLFQRIGTVRVSVSCVVRAFEFLKHFKTLKRIFFFQNKTCLTPWPSLCDLQVMTESICSIRYKLKASQHILFYWIFTTTTGLRK